MYTLQGWIKGVNGHEFSYALGYYEGDYQSIGTSSNLATPVAGNLYNGNIATMATHTPALGTKNPAQAWQTQQFVYDQLNRIKESRTTGGHENAYRTGYSYDANGNIVSLSRFDGSGTKQFDQLAYRYENKQSGYGRNTNKLRWVDDGTSVTEDFEDIRDQDIDNYEYDAIGNLVRDEQEEIDRIEWTVYGKVKAVHRKAGSEKPYLEFGYDAGGNRISKLSRDKDGHEKVTLYVRDASGNVMALYEKTPEKSLAVTEHHVYGSSRLGIARTTHPTDLAMLHSGRVLGLKDFELSDHLGNVRVVLKDVRNSVGLTEVSAAYDYYAFGMMMPGKKVNNGYRHGFNGLEVDRDIDENHISFADYGYSPRLGRRWNIDPATGEFSFGSPYAFAFNMPMLGNDKDGEFCIPCAIIAIGLMLSSPPVNAPSLDEEANNNAMRAAYNAYGSQVFGSMLLGGGSIIGFKNLAAAGGVGTLLDITVSSALNGGNVGEAIAKVDVFDIYVNALGGAGKVTKLNVIFKGKVDGKTILTTVVDFNFEEGLQIAGLNKSVEQVLIESMASYGFGKLKVSDDELKKAFEQIDIDLSKVKFTTNPEKFKSLKEELLKDNQFVSTIAKVANVSIDAVEKIVVESLNNARSDAVGNAIKKYAIEQTSVGDNTRVGEGTGF